MVRSSAEDSIRRGERLICEPATLLKHPFQWHGVRHHDEIAAEQREKERRRDRGREKWEKKLTWPICASFMRVSRHAGRMCGRLYTRKTVVARGPWMLVYTCSRSVSSAPSTVACFQPPWLTRQPLWESSRGYKSGGASSRSASASRTNAEELFRGLFKCHSFRTALFLKFSVSKQSSLSRSGNSRRTSISNRVGSRVFGTSASSEGNRICGSFRFERLAEGRLTVNGYRESSGRKESF